MVKRDTVLVLAHLFQRLAATLHNAVCDLDYGHPPRERCTGVAICDVADVLQTQLTGIQHTPQSLQHLFDIIATTREIVTYLVRLDALHGMLHHYPSVQ